MGLPEAVHTRRALQTEPHVLLGARAAQTPLGRITKGDLVGTADGDVVRPKAFLQVFRAGREHLLAYVEVLQPQAEPSTFSAAAGVARDAFLPLASLREAYPYFLEGQDTFCVIRSPDAL